MKSQFVKATYNQYVLPTTQLSEKGKTIKTSKRLVVASDWGKGEMNRQSTENF